MSRTLSLVDASGTPVFDASALLQQLLDNGKRLSSLPRESEPLQAETPWKAPAPYTLAPDKPKHVAATVAASFPEDLALDARSTTPATYAPLPPSARPVTMRRASAVRAVLADEERVVGQVAGANPTASFGGKLYSKKDKELPPIWGGLKVGTRKLVVVTGVRARKPPAR